MKGEVQIYRNLHRNLEDGGAVYSIRNNDGIVEGHESFITLEDCKLRVSDKGNERVRDEMRKNVHAYIQGKPAQKIYKFGAVEITYNPYKYKSFVIKKPTWFGLGWTRNEPVHEAQAVFTTPYKVFAVI